MDVKERIQKYLDYKGIKTATLEREVGMSNGYWRKTKSISANIVSDILRVYSDLSEKWVLFGEGMMCGCSPDDPSLYGKTPSAPIDGVSTDSQRTHSGGTTEDVAFYKEQAEFYKEQAEFYKQQAEFYKNKS